MVVCFLHFHTNLVDFYKIFQKRQELDCMCSNLSDNKYTEEKFSRKKAFSLVAIRLSIFIGLYTMISFQNLYAQGPATEKEFAEFENDELSGVIRGFISEDNGGFAIPFAQIQLIGTQRGCFSNQEGRFFLDKLAAGEVLLLISSLGYEDQLVGPVMLEKGDEKKLHIQLKPISKLTEEVIVTATGRPQSARLAAASVSVVDRMQIEEKNLLTFDQAFDEVPGVLVTRSSGSNVQAFSIRGASEVAGGGVGNRVLLLVDGRPALSPESGGALWNLAPLNAIEKIEVVKGAYSSLYGSSAMGGVVNIITRKPTDKPETQIHALYGYYEKRPELKDLNMAQTFKGLSFSHTNQKGKWGYVLDGGWQQNEGHREKTAFDLLNVFTKVQWQASQNKKLSFSANLNHILNDAPSTWLSASRPFEVAGFKKDDYQNRREANMDLHYDAFVNNRLKFSSRFYYYRNDSRYQFDSDPGNDSTNINIGKQIIKKSAISAQRLGQITQVDWHPSENHYIIMGLDVKADLVNGTPDTFLYGRQEAFSAGIFVQDEFSIGSAITATAGMRLDHYQVGNLFAEQNVSPKFSILFKPSQKHSLRLLLAQAFRNPSIAERFIKFEQGGGLRFQPNPELRAEHLILSFELGGQMQVDDRTSLDACFFYNRYNNLISFQQVSMPLEPLVFKVINLKEAVMQGMELALRHQVADFMRFSVSYTFLDARDVSPERLNDVLPYKVRHLLNVSSTFSKGRLNLHLNGRYRSAVKEVFIYPGNEPGAAIVISGKASYAFNKSGQLYMAVDNITDFQYEELERYRMPGRTFTAGFNYKF